MNENQHLEERLNYLKAIEARSKQTADDSFIVLEPIQEKYEDRNGNKFTWIFGSFGIGFGVLLFALIWPGYSESEKKQVFNREKTKTR